MAGIKRRGVVVDALAEKALRMMGIDPVKAWRPDDLIDRTFRAIQREYRPGTNEWIKKNRPLVWGELLILEDRINEVALRMDREALEKALAEYRTLMLAAIKEFSLTNGGPLPGCLTDKLGTIGS